MSNNTEKLMQKLLDLQAEYESHAKKIGKPAFKEMAAELFEACPDLEVIRWTQYAPHFNDGDACIFAVWDVDFYCQEVDEETNEPIDKSDYEFGYGGEGTLKTWDEKEKFKGKKELKKFDDFLHTTLGEDLCQRVFGDCAEVIMWRDGTVESDYYQHD